MLKHRVRRRNLSQGSDLSNDSDLVGNLFSPTRQSTQISPLSPAASISASASTLNSGTASGVDTASSSTLGACFGSSGVVNKWSSAGGLLFSRLNKSDDEDHGNGSSTEHTLTKSNLTSPAKTHKSSTFRLPTRRRTSSNNPSSCSTTPTHQQKHPPASSTDRSPIRGAVNNSNGSEIMRRWNSFHSTRGECHPNRFRRHRKSTSPQIDPERFRKLSAANMAIATAAASISGPSSPAATGGGCGSASSIHRDDNQDYHHLSPKQPLCPLGYAYGGRHSVSYVRHSIQDDSPQIIHRNWQLKRGQSLATETLSPRKLSFAAAIESSSSSSIVIENQPKQQQQQQQQQQQHQQQQQQELLQDQYKRSQSKPTSSSATTSPSAHCFGKRNGGSVRRPSECFVLETSEMIVIDYPETSQLSSLSSNNHFNQPNSYNLLSPGSKTCSNDQQTKHICCNTPQITSIITSNDNIDILSTSPLLATNRSDLETKVKETVTVDVDGGGCGVGDGDVNTTKTIIDITTTHPCSLNLNSSSNTYRQIDNINLTSPLINNSNCRSGIVGVAPIKTTTTAITTPTQSVIKIPKSIACSLQQHSSSIVSGTNNGNTGYQNIYFNHHRNSTPAAIRLGGSGCTEFNQITSSNLRQQYNSIVVTSIMDSHHMRLASFPGNRPELYQKCNRGSHSSDTSSAYSGSDTMTSVHSSSLDTDEVDLSGLVESVVDSDEEDLAESMDSLNVRDAVRECLEKDPSERTEDDIETLLEFTQGLKAFTNITLAVRRALCSVMVFAVVDKAGTTVMSDGEELDSWSVLINGHVEIDHGNGEKKELQVGDSFGILPTMDKLYHRGVMRTKCDDCQFVCITQTDYYRIQHQGEENTKRHEEDGHVVMVTELRQIGADNTQTTAATSVSTTSSLRRGHVVIRGTIERLLLQLIEENSITDPTYVEDFLLTHRTFIDNPKEVAKQVLQWFENEDTSPIQTTASGQEIRDRVTRVVLLWVNNHFTDFETDTEMMEFLEKFEAGLEMKNMLGQLRLLHIACAAKARIRNVTLTRSSRDENLHFIIIGGYERGGYGIFISKVDKKTKSEEVGLKRGDQILEVNGQSFEHVQFNRAMEILMGSTHLSITVKSNLLAFKEMLQTPDNNSPRPRPNRRRICANDIAKLHSDNCRSTTTTITRLSSVDMLSMPITSSSSLSNHDQVDYCKTPFKDHQQQSIGNSITNLATNIKAGLLGNNSNSSTNNKKDTSTGSTTSSNLSITALTSQTISMAGNHHNNKSSGFMTLGPKRRLQKALIRMNLLPKNSSFAATVNSIRGGCGENIVDSSTGNTDSTSTDDILFVGSINSSNGNIGNEPITSNNSNNSNNSLNNNNNFNCGSSTTSSTTVSVSGSGGLFHSHSNPDITTIYYEDTRQTDYPEHVLKVYKSDQTCKYLLINKETTAHEVVMLALQEFGIHETSSNFSLCEVSVGDGGMIKQRRLPEQLQNLAERIGLASRYYLKTNGITETLVPDDLAPDLVRDSVVHFLQLNANEVAIQLTFQDFAIFRQIESTEYVDDLFELKSKYGVPMLTKFAELVNREMFWVVTEVCSEHNMVRRMKIVKQFIKIARHCKECRNFNSMFAIISGLGHAAVSRLRQTWEKLPSKYQKLFADLQDLMDPSRNMSKYRQLVSAELLAQHPIIPFYPVVKKDLTFIHLGNDTRVETLINFEKLRMIAKEVRILTHMCSSTYDLLTMLEFKGQPPSSAMVALNQMSVSTGPHNLYAGSQATVKRRKKSTAAPNPKKMFEEAQMVRRVKAYLNNMKVINDEDVLHNLSLDCEPSTSSNGGGSGSGSGGGGGGSISGGSAPSSVTIRKRHPSPTLSTTSSTSSTSEGKKAGGGGGSVAGPKFGTASPQAVKKILSLSESTKTRPHQPRHGGIPLPLVVGHPHGIHHPLHSSISPSPSPGAHRRMGSSSSSGSATFPIQNFIHAGASAAATAAAAAATGRAVHERSHSDTPTPLPSVDLSAESSSVTSLSNLPLRKNITSGSVTSSDSGHGSCVQADTHSNCSADGSSGLYHVASTIVHNNTSPSPTLQQRRHSTIHAPTLYYNSVPSTPNVSTTTGITTTPISSNNASSLGGGGISISANKSSPPPPPLPPHLPIQHNNDISLLQQQKQQHQKHNTACNIIGNLNGVGNNNLNGGIIGGNGNCGGVGGFISIGIVGGASGGVRAAMQYQSYTAGPPLPPPPPHTSCVSNTYSQQQQKQQQQQQPHHQQQTQQQHISQSPLQYHNTTRNSGGHTMVAPHPPKGPRHPPAYSVAAQMARLHRLGRAHSHEGVTSNLPNTTANTYYHHEPGVDDEDEDNAQVSAV